MIRFTPLCKLLHGGEDGSLQIELRVVGGVDVDADAVQGGLDGLLAAGVEHLGPDRRSVGIPADEHKLGGRTAVVGFELQIDEAVAAVVLGELGAEVVVGLFDGAALLDLDGLLVLGHDVDEVPELVGALLELEVVEGLDDLVVYYYSR